VISKAHIEQGDGWARLRLSGEIDMSALSGADEVVARLLEGQPKKVIVDLSDVDFMDSSGIGVIAMLVRGQRDSEGVVEIVDAKPIVIRAIETCGLDRYLTFVTAPPART
jgi:anti-anti-sigma factor